MRVLLLANHFNTGGITTYLLTLTGGYIRRGHEVVIASSGGDGVDKAVALGARVVNIPALRVKCECHPGLFFAARTVSRYVRENDIDILHAQTRVTQAVAALAGAWAGRPYVSTCHGFFKPRLSRRILPLWGRAAIAVSGPVVEHLKEGLGVSAEMVALVPNGVDTDIFRPIDPHERQLLRQRFGIAQEPLVGIIARLSDVKGHDCLIAAMSNLLGRLPEAKCLIIGDGPMEKGLKALVVRLKLQETVFFAPINGKPAELLPMFDVFVMPSLQEGLGLSVMEAQACAVPVVASRVGGLIQAVKDGETGILVPPQDPVALAEALEKILADKPLAERFGRCGRERIKAQFAVDPMVDGTLAVYGKVLEHA